ncbi:MAG: GNAT family N-acetyltransferase [Acidobacteriota bacterium]
MMILRKATPADVSTILKFIRELAVFEREPDAVVATEDDLLRDGWSLAADGVTPLVPAEPQRFRALIAEVDGAPAGFALYFTTYSTWRGHHGIWLEDLYVTPGMRGRGVGKALLARVARIALEEGCPRLEWSVLDWNESAIAVYRKVGAVMMDEWTIMRMTGEPIAALAATDNVS